MKRRFFIIIGIVLGFSFYGLFKIYDNVYHISPTQPSVPSFKVTQQDTYDLKPVSARIDSQHRTYARSRVNGTILSIHVQEGDKVKEGDILLSVVDSKIIPQIEAIDAQIKTAQDQLTLAQTDFDRALGLKESKVISQADFDKKQTAFNVAQNTLKNYQAQRETLITQQREGHVLAPINGKVLTIPVTVGSVMMMGENAVELAGGDFILKLSIPQSHAPFLKNNDNIDIQDDEKKMRKGEIIKIYPKLQNGQILADVKLDNIDQLYVDQLLTAFVKTRERKGIFIPHYLILEKFGLNFVHVKNAGEVTVEIGRRDGENIEIISGLHAGDELLCP
ncbi:MAG: Multidrug resistance protein MdtA [Holosporales bacterium]